ncbi:hypothetical protein LINJ_23_0670 [Leishmania infantum JPCM5]|uniref:Galactose_oxidase_-_central_domain_containing_protein_-_putative n=2 Tax=Leishmania infantum TaxID=5671 RepID=A0A6L0XDS6_LEIIN|nr:hypothetical protein LINJ_23_0670 [Leishmania infantum JPCM5]CAC9489349.1 Galactose_oxidase_-_central_domain_containing_protein_-_putative [Leishmania infantum]CAM68169.1 hypothetical protein LINJ_23_0670 [Leishmania infantum JPCM5]SUZ41940.1 Galactose_oxidase_-_central_domain_containing_protein_-_putative [Leishmania infantum]|eukprot:XP_001465742.1 hypothetical protein LINJ_23_0670 [Leishmania infantum JPCM5]
MNDTSFLSGLSSIGEAIGETAYGRCISIFVISCEPSLDELAVRLGGPGCPWETVQLPMRQPVVLHRHPGARVARRATELAFAMKSYVESLTSDVDDLHPTGGMAAMDILTSTAISAAASTLTTSAGSAAAVGGPVTELTAATDTLNATPDAEGNRGASQPSLHVCFHWAIGEVLPEFDPPAADATKNGEGDDAVCREKAHDREDGKSGSYDGRKGGGEVHYSSNGVETSSEAPATTAPAAETAAATAHEEAMTEAQGGHGEEAAAGVAARFNPPLCVNPLSAYGDTLVSEVMRTADDDRGGDVLTPQKDGYSAAISGALSSPPRSKTPRRQRPQNYRSSIIHMEMTPVMASPSKEAGGHGATTESLVKMSEDNDEDEDNVAPVVMHFPPPPPATGTARPPVVHSEPQEVALDTNIMAPVRLSNEAERLCNTVFTPLSFNNETEGTLVHQRRAAPASEEQHNTAAAVKAPAPPQPTANNLFEGADSGALIVMVGVVAIYSTSGTADPHRVVSVEVSATTADKEGTMHHPDSHTSALSFRTTPALRGLAAVVPQVSSPVLLLSRYPNDASRAAGDDDRGVANTGPAVPPALHATCILTENVASMEGGTAGSCTSTTLWTSVADVAPRHGSLLLSVSSPAPAPQMSHEVRFTGANGDVVLTLWTYMTVSAYRDAVLNLRSRATESSAQPVLQMLLIDESPSRTTKTKTSSCRNPSTATVWVSSPSSSHSARADGIAHRVVTVSSAYDIVQQPVNVPVRGPLVYVAVQPSTSASAASDAQPIFLHMFSDAWTRLAAPSRAGGTRAASSTSATAVLYYRLVNASTAAAAAESSSLPAPLRERPRASSKTNKNAELREVTIMINPPATFLSALPPSTGSHINTGVSTAADQSDAAFRPASAWNLALCHAVTHAVLAEASPETGVLVYHGFLPVLSDRRRASGKCEALGAAGTANADTPPVGEEALPPYEVTLVPAAGLPKTGDGASPPLKPAAGTMRPITTTSPARAAPANRGSGLASQGVAKAASPNAWSGAVWFSSSALYSAASTGAHWKTSICVSSAPALLSATTLMLRSPSAALGAQLEVTCAVRSHTLDTDSAVFCLRSLRLVPSSVAGGAQGPPTAASPLPLSQVQLWFTTSGGSAEEVRAAWGVAGAPSAKELQHAWAPAVPASSSCCTPALCVDADGQLASTGPPVLLSTTNARARLCVALTTAAETTAVSDGTADARALRHCVATVRKSVIHRYKAHASSRAEQGSNEADNQRQAQPQLTEEQMAEVFVQCVNAVAMGVDNYAEVDLSPSLVAASERPGGTRHRLLISFVSGAIRMSHHVVLELQGQWIKMPRRVTVVSENYTPSPRLWALRRSCIVRHPDPLHRAVCSRVGVSDGVRLAQKVLEAYMGYDVAVQSVPLDYTDPSEHAVQTLLPGLLYDKLVLQVKQKEARLQPYCEVIRILSSGMLAASLRRGGHAAAALEKTASDHDDMAFEETTALLEHIFGPAGLAHAAYVSGASRKVAIVHFFFGDAYTTRTVLNVSCTVSVDAMGAVPSVPTQPCGDGHSPLPPSPGGSVSSIKKATSCSTAFSSSSLQVLCDSLIRTSTLCSFLPVSSLVHAFPGESRHRYPSELTWYHGSLNITSEEEQRRREEGEAAWRRGLTEQRLGVYIKPGPLVVSAITQHPCDCLPLLVEPSLTRCADGQHYIVFGGLSATARTASSSVYAFDDTAQTWKPLRARLSSRGMASSSTPAAVPPPRYGHTAVYRPADAAVYIFGGRGRSGDAEAEPMSDSQPRDDAGGASALVYSDVWRLSWDANAGTVAATELHCTWADKPSRDTGGSENRISSMLTGDFEGGLARWRHAAVLHNDYIVVIGGQSSSGACCSCAEVLYLDIGTQEWAARRSFGTEVPCPRYGLAATLVSGGSALYIFGGWGHEQSKAGKLHSAAHSGSDANGAAARKDEEQSAVALSDFFKLDLITRMWSRVEPNGTVRPPALELADMTSCIMDDCPVILLVGGRTSSAVVATPTAEQAAASPLMVFLFSTATLFWRIVRMDCTPVATRFGLRAVASAASAKAPGLRNKMKNAQRAHSSCARRSLPLRGPRIGSILIVGGLPLEEAEIAQTTPAISMLLAAGNGSAAASRRAASVSRGMGESVPSKQGFLTPGPPPVPRSTAMGRPMTGPARTTSRGQHPPPSGHRRAPAIASGWLQTSQSMRASGDGRYEHSRAAGVLALPTTSAVAIRQLTERLHGPASVLGQATTAATPAGPHHPSCYSTLTPSQQRRLVRRLYTQSIEIRAVHRQQLQNEVNQERATPAFRTIRSRRCSPGAGRSSMPAGESTAPLHRPPYGAAATVDEGSSPSATRDTIEANGSGGAFIHGGPIAGVSLAGRDLQDAFLVRGSRSSSLTTSSSSNSRMSSRSESEWDAEVVGPQPVDASSTALSGEGDGSDSKYAKHVEKVDAGAKVSEAESAAPEPDDAIAGIAATLHCDDAKTSSEDEGSAVTEKKSEKSESCKENDDHFEVASSDGSSAVRQWRNAVAPTAANPVPISMPVHVPAADMESEEVKVGDEKDDASVATSGPPQADEVAPAAEVEEEEPHKIEQQAPHEPATPPPASQSSSKSLSLPPAALAASEKAVAGDEAAAAALCLPDDSSAVASPLPSIHSIPAVDHDDKIDRDGASDDPEEDVVTPSTPPLEVRGKENEAQPKEKNDDYADTDDDWESMSNADENDGHAGRIKSTSSAESRFSIGEAAEELMEDPTPPPAPREHTTPPSSSSVLSLPPLKEARIVPEVTAVRAEELSEAATASSDSSSVEDVAEKPLGAVAEEAVFSSQAREVNDVFSSFASSLADAPAVAAPAVEAPAAPVSPLQSSNAGDEDDSSEAAPSTPAVGTSHLAAAEEDDKEEAAFEEPQQDADALVEQPPAAPPTPSSTSFAALDSPAAPPVPASFSDSRQDSRQWADTEGPHATATPPAEAIEPALAVHADIGDENASSKAETPIDESEAATPLPVAEQPEEEVHSSNESDNEAALAANAAPATDCQTTSLSDSSEVLSETPEAPAAVPDSHASSVAAGNVYDAGAAAASPPTHDEEVEETQDAQRLHGESDFGGEPGVQDDAEESGLAMAMGPSAADVDEKTLEGSSATLMQSRHGQESMGEEQRGSAAAASVAESSVHNEGDSGLRTPAASQVEESGSCGWEELEEGPAPAAELSEVEDTAGAEQVTSVSMSPMREEASDNWSELSSVEEEEALVQESRFAPVSAEPSKDEKDDAVPLSDELNAVGLSAPAAAVSTYSDEETPATQVNASPATQAATEDAYEEFGTQSSSEEEVKEAAMGLNDGRDLLDRRRGVEAAIHDDDFDF